MSMPARPTSARHPAPAPTSGLYDPRFEHDACGVAFVVDLEGRASHGMVAKGLTALRNLDHRGATGAEDNVGDGAGILLQVPDAFFRAVCDFELPPAGTYAVGLAFLPREPGRAERAAAAIERIVVDEDLRVVGWRDTPVDDTAIGSMARDVEPTFRHLFIAAPDGHEPLSGLDLERRAYVVRKRIEHEIGRGAPLRDERATDSAADTVYFPSLSGRTLVYKGMLTSLQLGDFFLDLTDERLESALALVHSRFSTNTFPSWPLAHPYRVVAHNGEINTVMGNRNWMHAREGTLSSELFGERLSHALPIMTPDASDTASFDECLELLHLGGRSLPHAVLMMIPEAWENHTSMDDARREFYAFHAALMEPWDGPASIAFTDGTVIGAVLDRNGLRPSRYWVTDEGLVVMASEVGVLDIDPSTVVTKGRLQPGRMFLVDTGQGRIVADEEIKAELAAAEPYGQWLEDGLLHLDDLPERTLLNPQHASVVRRQRTFGYTTEELKIIMAPMARIGAEPIGSMGTDTPIAVLSERPRLLFDYFSQLFAQVTNPPLDAIREELVTSMAGTIGPEANLLAPGPDSCRQIVLPRPILSNDDLAKILYVNEDGKAPGFQPFAIDGLFPVAEGAPGLERALDEICTAVSAAIADGAKIIVLSDRYSNAELAPIPSLLLTGAVHHHLIRERTRTQVGLVVESGDAREVHHMALLIGFGAAAINPYIAFETIDDLVGQGLLTGLSRDEARRNYRTACAKGVIKIMSKMGISTVASYTGAQVFEAVGLSPEVVDRHFTGTTSKLGGVGLDQIARDVAERHRFAYLERPEGAAHRDLWAGGEYQWRREGEHHLFNPETVFKLQHGTRSKRYEIYKEYTSLVDDQSKQLMTLRGLFRFATGQRPPVPIEEVEPVSAIVRRFSTGAMSYGSISAEAHETLAIAMNRLGAKSNTGEGGEDAERYTPDANGDLRRSAIKQVASGRFGVTSEYLTNADDIQIKMAQGAKPGEGGQLPGQKVWPWIAKTRYSTPGVGLISPPPHHDIYSIEDLAQLIFDLKSVNPRAQVSVKLVAAPGVGTIAAGVAKAYADLITISGYDGGTGASPLTSILYAGSPWELGLAEAHQSLRANGLRGRVRLQTDGGIKTGRDVIKAALLGAESFGFGTAPLVALGCKYLRICHLNNCATGVATQNQALRDQHYNGVPDMAHNYFRYVAQDVREWLAWLGFERLEDIVGRTDLLERLPGETRRQQALDLTPITTDAGVDSRQPHLCQQARNEPADQAELAGRIAAATDAAVADGTGGEFDFTIANHNRTIGARLSGAIAHQWGNQGMSDRPITLNLRGTAGQSLGAWNAGGLYIDLVGEANDYVGKGMTGGRIVIRPPVESRLATVDTPMMGNTCLYGATGGRLFAAGTAGQRFAVRNSGAVAVIEGCGDHGCEYMTGGAVVVLGRTGLNFGAGMTGGLAYVLDLEREFVDRHNRELIEIHRPTAERWEAHVRHLRDLIAEHVEQTRSEHAAAILEDLADYLPRFWLVTPKAADLSRMLEAARAAA